MIDIIVINRNRLNFLEQCLKSIWENTKDYRLTLIDDYSDTSHLAFYLANREKFHQIILNGQNFGSTYSMDSGLQLAFLNQWFWNSDFIAFMEDDIVVPPNWSEICKEIIEKYEKDFKIGFIGWDAPEHNVWFNQFEYKGYNVKIKSIARSSFLFARTDHWKSIGLIPRLKEDGSERGKPDKGNGSERDHYLLTKTTNSNKNQGKFVACISGFINHLGENESTWRIS